MELRSCCVQKLVWKFKNRISKILLFLMFMEIMCIQVHAAELELEAKTYSDSNPYNFKFSYTWTSEGKTIQSYDVSENGQIAIAFSDNTIGVFDKNMNFMYQLSFLCSGASGVLWLGENLLFIDLRSNTAVVCDNYGRTESFYEIIGPENYYYEVVEERMRKRGDDRYYCTNGSGGNNPLVHYGSYSILKRTSKEGEEEILYEADVLLDGALVARLVILVWMLMPLFAGGGVIVIWFWTREERTKNHK